MTFSEIFLDYYSKLEKHLRENGSFDRETSFSHMVKNSQLPVIKRHKSELLSFSELRNAIVHHPRIGGRTIAEPHPDIVEQLKVICGQVINPTKVIPKYQFEVFSAIEADSICSALKQMKAQQFSQFPVLDKEGGVIELITSNTISRWLSSQFETEGGILAEDARVGDLLCHIEFSDNYAFLSRNADVYLAADMFLNHIDTYKRNLDCIFITQHGKSNQSLLGLITIEDIAAFILEK